MSLWHRVAKVEAKVEMLDETVSAHSKMLSDHQALFNSINTKLDSLMAGNAEILAMMKGGLK
jgi:hypothetical protein